MQEELIQLGEVGTDKGISGSHDNRSLHEQLSQIGAKMQGR
jgi:hypothetical protein